MKDNHNTRLDHDNKYWNYQIKYGGIIAKDDTGFDHLFVIACYIIIQVTIIIKISGIRRYETGDIYEFDEVFVKNEDIKMCYIWLNYGMDQWGSEEQIKSYKPVIWLRYISQSDQVYVVVFH